MDFFDQAPQQSFAVAVCGESERRQHERPPAAVAPEHHQGHAEADDDGLAEAVGLDGQVAALLGVELTLSRRGDHVRLDGSRSDDRARGPINFTTNPGLLRIAFGRYLQSLDPDLEVNDGLLRNLDDTEGMI